MMPGYYMVTTDFWYHHHRIILTNFQILWIIVQTYARAELLLPKEIIITVYTMCVMYVQLQYN